MVTVGTRLTNASALSHHSFVAGAPSCPPSTASSLESAGHVPKANCEGALASLPPPGDCPASSRQSPSPPAWPPRPKGAPLSRPVSKSESGEPGRVGCARSPAAGR